MDEACNNKSLDPLQVVWLRCGGLNRNHLNNGLAMHRPSCPPGIVGLELAPHVLAQTLRQRRVYFQKRCQERL
jgi:hypothetical protein